MSRFGRRMAAGVAAFGLAAGFGGGAAAQEDDVRIGALFDVTGPIANFMPPLLAAAQMVADEVNANGGILGGRTLTLVVADTQGNAQGAVDAATKLVNIDNVADMVGAFMSGTAIAAASAVSIPAGVVQISPTATSPEMTGLADNDFIFRVVPSDDYQGLVLARLLLDKGLDQVALTYVNNDYGVGIADTFRRAYTAAGGTITADQVHEPEKASYRSELATLAEGDPQALVLIAYAGDSGVTIVRQALENGFFDRFVGTDGLRDNLLIEQIGAENLGDIVFTSPSSPPGTTAAEKFDALFSAASDLPLDSAFIRQTYDSTFLAALAIQQAGSTDRTAIRDALRQVANPPGEVIEPGEWAKAVELIAAGTDINYEGAAGPADFDEAGDVAGVIGEFVIEDGAFRETGLLEP